MRLTSFMLAVACLGQASQAWDDIILEPIQSDTSLPERLLVVLPGGLVENSYYKTTAQAIQKATTDLRLTVVIPQVFQKLCIVTCGTSSLCSELKSRIDDAVAKSAFKSKNPKEDTFVAGHSLGATCANNLMKGYHFEFAGLMEFGGYTDLTGSASIANFPIPVLHAAGELDGGGARPSTMAGLYRETKEYALTHGWDDALKMKPVQVLEGLDHSSFCPGLFVTKTKDCMPEVAQKVALATIGEVASAFLHLNSPTSEATKGSALRNMKKRLTFTQEMTEPFLVAYQLEKGPVASPQALPAGVPAGPWCAQAQHKIVGLGAADASKLKVEPCTLVTAGLHAFEHQHTNYTILPDGSLDVTCYSFVEAPGASIVHTQFAPQSIDCKMVDATRAAEQLHVKTKANMPCSDINRMAVEVAKKLLPAKSLKRYEAKGRGFCFMPDSDALIGPNWLLSKVKTDETTKCLEVTSSKLVSNIKSLIYPGNHYCKLLSPSAAMDWMMTDSHKPFPYHGPYSGMEDITSSSQRRSPPIPAPTTVQV